MRLMNVNSRIAINTVLARFAPTQSGTMGFRHEGDDVVVFAIERCDHCNREVEGANSITIVKPRNLVLEAFAMRKVLERADIVEEIGCNDDGDAVCPDCYENAENARSAKAV